MQDGKLTDQTTTKWWKLTDITADGQDKGVSPGVQAMAHFYLIAWRCTLLRSTFIHSIVEKVMYLGGKINSRVS